jgi:NitT/TauT family transport system substrate-binding protein
MGCRTCRVFLDVPGQLCAGAAGSASKFLVGMGFAFLSERPKATEGAHTPMNSIPARIAAVLTSVAIGTVTLGGAPARALDKVVVAVNAVSSALPYFVAVDQGFFKEAGIEPEMKKLAVPSLVISGMITGQIETVAVMLAIDGMNANAKKPGVINYIGLNAQSAKYRMEQFVVRKDFAAKEVKDLKGARIACVPGLGNVTLAKAGLAAAGLKEGDYTLDQMEMAQHINVIKSGQYDAAYTLEPGATMMDKMDVAKTIQAGVIAQVVLGDPNANAYVGGPALSGDFIEKRPDVARRYVQAWTKAVDFINSNPAEARKSLLGNTVTPEAVVDVVPLLLHTMVPKLSAEDKRNFQAYVDYAVKIGAISDGLDTGPYLKAF